MELASATAYPQGSSKTDHLFPIIFQLETEGEDFTEPFTYYFRFYFSGYCAL